jgi:hypothetical protein
LGCLSIVTESYGFPTAKDVEISYNPAHESNPNVSREAVVDQHVKIVAVLNIVMGILGVLIALGVLLLFGGLAGVAGTEEADPSGPVVLGLVGGLVFVTIAIFSVPCIIAGYGLLHFRPWAHTLTIVMSILNLLSVPFGTALGIYSLWVLMNKETKPLFKTA